MSVLVDTSALFAILDADDRNHDLARDYLAGQPADEQMVTHNYVLTEAAALTQARLGAGAIRALFGEIAPRLEVVWIDEDLHRSAVAALLAAARRRVSLVDWTSFEVMRRRAIGTAFAFDRDFPAEGFETVP